MKVNLKEGAQILQNPKKDRPIPLFLQDLKRLIDHGFLEITTEITEDCLVISPVVITVNKKQIGDNCLGFKKIKRN